MSRAVATTFFQTISSWSPTGQLDFVVDQQPYVQGFAPVMQLFLARISQGVVVPWDTETSVLLRRSDVRMFLATKSRFEGSSSRQAYPLRRA